ncbi:hypothetical protein Sipo8835_01705 [Streptomyces ipomoeae]|uniref:Uncharacterized protein n=1 Tax=Streptomyces ipomoeae TaxID=103232 RepID=A0AAE8W719_9ACTN|nr:hypothetical protein Sipo7851_06025 [Streptomyces ipomoeae]TQE39582.1 hypothetical protein Sipo8835_01705 [Streptomyces ipomoeae]
MPSQANPTKRDVSPKADREGYGVAVLGDDLDGLMIVVDLHQMVPNNVPLPTAHTRTNCVTTHQKNQHHPSTGNSKGPTPGRADPI